MAEKTTLTPPLLQRLAEHLGKDSNDDVDIRAFGVALGFEDRIIDDVSDGPTGLLNKWANGQGTDDAAAKRLLEVLDSKGYARAAEILKKETTKRQSTTKASHAHGHSHDQPERSTMDRVITYATTIIVAILAIAYVHYKDFKV